MPFPFLRLPGLAFDAVYQCLDISEIIFLTQCSQRMRDIVSGHETSRFGRRIEVAVNKTSCSVAVGKPDPQGFKGFTWVLSSRRDNQLAEVREYIDRKIDGVTWKVGEKRGGWLSIPDDGCMEKDLLTLLKMFKSIFNCPVHRTTLNFEEYDFDKLLIESDALHKAESITVLSTALFKEEADFLLDNLITDKLDFHGYAGRDYVYEKPLNFPKINISCAAWISFEKLMVMTSTCKSVELETATQISDENLNHFIKKWLESDEKRLETVKIVRDPSYTIRSGQRNDPVAHFQRPAIMEGITATQGCKKRPDAAEYYKSHVKYENGLDIRRDDGVLATVLIEQETYRGGFIFTVWYDENPHLMVNDEVAN